MIDLNFTLVALDCPDPVALAHFYAELTGWNMDEYGDTPIEEIQWIEIYKEGQPAIAFQRAEHYLAPTWPEGPVPQQLHLDFDVSDLDEGEAFVLGLGATKAAFQPGETFRVYLDPVGHPFCLVLRRSA